MKVADSSDSVMRVKPPVAAAMVVYFCRLVVLLGGDSVWGLDMRKNVASITNRDVGMVKEDKKANLRNGMSIIPSAPHLATYL